MDPIITQANLASYLQQPDLPDNDVVIELANELVGEIVGQMTEYPAQVRAIALEVAARPVRAAGYTSVTISGNDTSKTWRRDGVTAAAAAARLGVYVAGDERLDLVAIRDGEEISEQPGAFTIRPGRR